MVSHLAFPQILQHRDYLYKGTAMGAAKNLEIKEIKLIAELILAAQTPDQSWDVER